MQERLQIENIERFEGGENGSQDNERLPIPIPITIKQLPL